jgi:DNA-binding LacI/PurR family transcriptional regulator
MTDVARLASVSHQTVSRVINGSDRVAAGTRDRVLAAMASLDYRPSSIARALKTGRSRTVGVISFATNLYGPGSALFAIERAAHEADYFISIAGLPILDHASLSDAVERLRGVPVDGILVIAPQRTAVEALVGVATGLPIVAVEAGPDRGGTAVVAVDQLAGGRLATQHLLGLGHRSVFHLAGPRGWIEAELRVEGWRAALAEAGAPAPEPAFGDWSPQRGYELGRRIAAEPDLTAVFVGNDQMAVGLLRALQEAGRRVPQDVSVVGFDDIPEAAFLSPPLTTVRQDFAAMGRRAFAVLLEQMEQGTAAIGHESIPPELVVRASTAPPGAEPAA